MQEHFVGAGKGVLIREVCSFKGHVAIALTPPHRSNRVRTQSLAATNNYLVPLQTGSECQGSASRFAASYKASHVRYVPCHPYIDHLPMV